MVTGNRSRNGFPDKPWVAIAAIAGVLIVVAGTLIFFFGGSANPAASLLSHGQGIPLPAGGTSGHNGTLAYNVVMTAGYELPDIIVPDKGTFIKVTYRGGYEGKYTSGNETQELNNSGERVLAIENPGPSIFAEVKKQDGSSKQALIVEIWKDGTRLMTNTTSLPFGEVTLSSSI